ncbi:serine/threonine-protein kinase [Pseudonocardia sp. TRM90224]|uniref:serine/threonine-protein kinase n=1 Tax=Pseudonocardia sp. TRM90224 TaxID=2812678 RepID=UPI001E5220D7|nr:serine/threonine-protein kinase [Pseudonocardia sp. TRM90224]
MTAARCQRPGCDGQIEDGFCNVCGHAGAAVEASVRTAAGRPDLTVPTAAGHFSGSTGSGRTGPGSWGSGSTGTGGSRPTRRGSGRTMRTGTARSRLGAGLVDVPPVPRIDPSSALLADPKVPEEKRFCGKCNQPVGRAREDRPGRTAGFCPNDGHPYNFEPKLRPGTLVAGQYEVRGCLAHGGLGWIYLAVDRNVDDRWVVLKGLLNAGDTDAMAAAVAEKRFLAQVSHPNIVSIFNFVEHPDDDGSEVGYIVMEYVGGSSLKQLLEARRLPDRTIDPLPVAQAIAYALEMLPALGHLHSLGLAYCDFKPENVIQYDRQLKLIDLGAVIRMDDQLSAIYGTIGYQAPEIAADGPSPASDVHTVGRTLAVLALGMVPARRGRPAMLPDPAEEPILARHESFHRALLRATDPDPLCRFESTDEMAEQLAGVLREVLSTDDGKPRPAVSSVFAQPRGTFAPGLLAQGSEAGRPAPHRVAAALPVPLVNTADPAAGLLASLATTDRGEVERIVFSTRNPSVELRLRLVRAYLDDGDARAARGGLADIAAMEPDDWRLDWYGGIAALIEGDFASACAEFDTVYSTLPGETAPKLALAAAAECAREDALAGRYYALAGRPDPSVADASFGLARVLLRAGDRGRALAALDTIPESSSRYVAAQLAAVQATLLRRSGERVGEPELRAAAARVERLQLDPATSHQVSASLFTAAVELTPANGPYFLGTQWNERELRLSLERCLRTSARLTSDARERVELVDKANAARPRTWI